MKGIPVKDSIADIYIKKYIHLIDKEAQSLGINFDTNQSFATLKRYLKFNPSAIYFYEPQMYTKMLPWAIKINQFINTKRGKLKLFCSICTHKHAFTPQIPYLAITFLWHDNDKNILKLKLGPYVGENSKIELCQGVTATQVYGLTNAFSYKHIYKLIDSADHFYSYINLSPSTLYTYYLVHLLKLGQYDNRRTQFEADQNHLGLFFSKLKTEYSIHFELKNGIPRGINDIQKVSDALAEGLLLFPHISSLVTPLI